MIDIEGITPSSLHLAVSSYESSPEALTWRAVLHVNIVHNVSSGARQLRTAKRMYGIAECGTVCQAGDEQGDGIRCATCFPLAWPTDADTQIIPIVPPPLPRRVPQPVPKRKSLRANRGSGWFGDPK